MLLTIQFPFADLRGFVPEETHRLDVPHWPTVRPGEEFVRSFGMVTLRGSGGSDDWVGEDVFCRADRALRFGNSLALLAPGLSGTGLRAACVFRRLLNDGTAVTRLEVGIRFSPRDRMPRVPLQAQGFVSLLRQLLDLPVHIGPQIECPLCRASKPLGAHYLRSTTRRTSGEFPSLARDWLVPARPVIMVEYESGEFASIPKECERVALNERASGIRLHHAGYIAMNGTAPWSIWYLGRSARSDHGVARNLRIHLLRLHAEKQCLREVLRAVGQRRLAIKAYSDSSNNLQAYLRAALRLLSRKERFGLPQSALLTAAAHAEDVISPGERQMLLSELERIRGNIRRAVEQYTRAPQPQYQTLIQPRTMTNVIFGDNAHFNGNLVVARSVRDAFNRAEDSNTAQGLRDALQNLARALAEIAPLLSPQQSDEVSRDLTALTDEALSASPRKRWYQISADGLVEAARKVGDSATPVIEAVTKILALLP